MAYDALNRVSSMQETTGSAEGCKSISSSLNPYTLSWAYDAWGNRTSQTPSSGTCSFSQSVDANNRLVDPPYQYDAAGNLTNDGTHSYAYDAANRVTSVDGGSTASYIYDGLGQRVRRTVGASSADYVYNVSGQAVTLFTNGGWLAGHVFLGGSYLAEHFNGTTYFVHSDHLRSTRLLTGMDQSVVQNLDYLPFGEILSSDSGITTHKFTGDERDSETNLDHTWFRQYSSQLGRWMHPDPAGLAAVDPTNPQSWNRYSYVLNNPLALIDPLGLNDNDCPDGSTCSKQPTECAEPGCAEWGSPIWMTSPFGYNGGAVDGIWTPLWMIAPWLQSGVAARCRNNDCTGLQLASGPGGTNLWWIPSQTFPGVITMDSEGVNVPYIIPGHWETAAIDESDWGLWDTIKAMFGYIPWSVTVTPTPGVITGAYIPGSNTLCVGGGLGVGVSLPEEPVAVNAGPLVFGDLKNAKQILEGPSIFYSFQPTLGIGWHHTFNTSGKLLGPTAGSWGGSAGFTVSGCWDLKK